VVSRAASASFVPGNHCASIHKRGSWPSLKTDLENAGKQWVDEQVVVDGNMVSSRKPDDIPAFNDAMVTLFSTAMHHAAHSE